MRGNTRTPRCSSSATSQSNGPKTGQLLPQTEKLHLYDPWRLDDGTLMPLGFRYQVPGISAEDA